MNTDVKYKLVRERDNLTKTANEIAWIRWSEDGFFSSIDNEPSIGRSLIMTPGSMDFTWLTTSITEILEHTETYIKFNTQNSLYTLFINNPLK